MSLSDLFEKLSEFEYVKPDELSGKELIGKKFTGVKYSNEKYMKPYYNPEMDEKIGEVGIITIKTENEYIVKFKDGQYRAYPKEIVENQINDI